MTKTVTRCLLATALIAVVLPAAHAQSALERMRGLGGGKAQTVLDVGSDALKGLSLTDAEVAALGAEAAAAYDAENTVAAANDPYAQRLARLVSGWENDAGLSLNFKVYKTPEINAFALPDGSVRVYSGLMDTLDDDELRFVIGHEIGHVKHGHSKARFRTAYLAQAARKGVASADNVAGALASSELGGLVESVVKAQHSQSNELESDGYGLGLLQRGGFEPQAAVTALQKLDDGGQKADMLSSHPDPASRARRIQSQLR
ncbi:M48 family metallopeptidase [Luteimonas sp. 3794]|uniref:M48 family metallopeptidase n=1 Tax=Luteimonas sp. 3794 TaxID=2817730 RepID=UPI002860FE7A|nr:M48 family metallopeptidase [Luteimonas sp. 3794]MDR6991427.1 putative metalloprotease [Luteimonas sp. 3794]